MIHKSELQTAQRAELINCDAIYKLQMTCASCWRYLTIGCRRTLVWGLPVSRRDASIWTVHSYDYVMTITISTD